MRQFCGLLQRPIIRPLPMHTPSLPVGPAQTPTAVSVIFARIRQPLVKASKNSKSISKVDRSFSKFSSSLGEKKFVRNAHLGRWR